MAKERRSDRKKDTNVTIETDEKLTKAPDGGWGWFVVLGCLFLRIVVGINFSFATVMIYNDLL